MMTRAVAWQQATVTPAQNGGRVIPGIQLWRKRSCASGTATKDYPTF
jgi:hypothetical protein